MKYFIAAIALLLMSCGLVPEQLSKEDPRRESLIQAASIFKRSEYGFTPIPAEADIRLELPSGKKYNAILHIYTNTTHTVAFKKGANGNYIWIGEQEIFNGPKQYVKVDGPTQENICLEYQIEKVEDIPTNQLVITYTGSDRRLAKRPHLSLAEVKPPLKEWGY